MLVFRREGERERGREGERERGRGKHHVLGVICEGEGEGERENPITTFFPFAQLDHTLTP